MVICADNQYSTNYNLVNQGALYNLLAGEPAQ